MQVDIEDILTKRFFLRKAKDSTINESIEVNSEPSKKSISKLSKIKSLKLRTKKHHKLTDYVPSKLKLRRIDCLEKYDSLTNAAIQCADNKYVSIQNNHPEKIISSSIYENEDINNNSYKLNHQNSIFKMDNLILWEPNSELIENHFASTTNMEKYMEDFNCYYHPSKNPMRQLSFMELSYQSSS